MNEEWRDIPNSRYQVSNLGRVRSLDYYYQEERHWKDKIITRDRCKKGRILKPALSGGNNKYNGNKGIYLMVNLCYEDKPKRKYVHRLVAEAFLDNPQGYTEVNHKDENPLNNCADNLEWCSREYNCNYGNRNKKVSEATTGKSKVHSDEFVEKTAEWEKFKDNASRYREMIVKMRDSNKISLQYYKENHKDEITEEFIKQMKNNIHELTQKKKQLTKLATISKADYLYRREQFNTKEKNQNGC